jgi:putative transposase
VEKLERQRPIHQDLHEGFNKPIVGILTVCTNGKKPILANEYVRTLLRESWCEIDSWIVGQYVLMPDHIHLFCSPALPQSPPLHQRVPYWRSHAERHWPKPQEAPVWQRDFLDAQMRPEESYDTKWRYVVENPVRAGLVTMAEDWAYQGELNALIW